MLDWKSWEANPERADLIVLTDDYFDYKNVPVHNFPHVWTLIDRISDAGQLKLVLLVQP